MNDAAAYEAMLAAYHRGALDEAARAARALLDAAPGHAGAAQLLGVVEARQGRFDAALAALDRAVEADPQLASAHNNRGNVLFALEREAEAVASYDRALALGLEEPGALTNRGLALRALHRRDAALRSFEQALARRPGFAEALLGRGELLLEMGRRDAGIASLQQAREAGADDSRIGFLLAALGVAPVAPRAPDEFVRELFDQYAHRFDAHLAGGLGYRTPALVGQLVDGLGLAPGPVVDLGCGTGLCAPLLRAHAHPLVGIDLSGAMLEHARARGLYDELVEAEITAELGRRPQAFGLAVAADVLVYFGALEELFDAVHAALRPGGCFVFSVEAGEADDHVLRPTRRYAHSAAYLERLAAQRGFACRRLEPTVLRHDQGGAEVRGLLAVLQRA